MREQPRACIDQHRDLGIGLVGIPRAELQLGGTL
jgi:hypothetical protein